MNNEEWYVILNMNCKYEICRRCPKSGLFKGTYEECEKWIEQKEKEEELDGIKNKISLALKDPILQQGFEIICKNLAELEAQLEREKNLNQCMSDNNEQLRKQIEKMKCCANCAFEPPFDKHCDNCIRGTINLRYRNWKLREIKENE